MTSPRARFSCASTRASSSAIAAAASARALRASAHIDGFSGLLPASPPTRALTPAILTLSPSDAKDAS
eukprot:30355-Pelagococcus_subviridis.AAC.5